MPDLREVTRGFLAGALTGVVGVVLPFPFESYRLKVLFAEIDGTGKTKVMPRTALKPSLFDLSLYKGLSGALFQGVLLRGFTFGTYDWLLRSLHQGNGGDYLNDPVYYHFAAGGVASLALAWVREPYNVFRCQTQAKTTTETSFTRYLIRNARKNLLTDLYAGFLSSASVGFISRGVYFSSYEAIKRKLNGLEYFADPHAEVNSSKAFPLSLRILAASVAGPFSLVIVYPFDVVRSRMRALDRSLIPPRYSSFSHCWKVTMKERALFRGVGLVLFRSAPMASITLPFYENVYVALGRLMGLDV